MLKFFGTVLVSRASKQRKGYLKHRRIPLQTWVIFAKAIFWWSLSHKQFGAMGQWNFHILRANSTLRALPRHVPRFHPNPSSVRVLVAVAAAFMPSASLQITFSPFMGGTWILQSSATLLLRNCKIPDGMFPRGCSNLVRGEQLYLKLISDGIFMFVFDE